MIYGLLTLAINRGNLFNAEIKFNEKRKPCGII